MKLLILVVFTTFLTLANAQLVEHTTHILKDTKTNFLWQDTEINKTKKLNFNQAVKYCENLELEKEKNWKLPDFMALFSIINTKEYNPTLSKEFKFFVSNNYWSSKTFGHGVSSEAFVINFLSGAFNRELMDDKFYVRCYKDMN